MKSEEYSAAFTSIAPYYDDLMSFINYPGWISYIEKILKLNRCALQELLDLACGTGTCLRLWLDRGYRVYGIDRSAGMLDACRRRLTGYPQDRFTLAQADMRDFQLPVRVPIVTCLYDSLNYLLTEADLASCFRSVRACLTVPGLFIFDMNTVHALRDEWGNQTFRRRDKNITSIWNNVYDQEHRLSTLHITLFIENDGKDQIFREIHQERAYYLEEIERLLRAAGFQPRFYRHLTFTPARDDDVRVMGVAAL